MPPVPPLIQQPGTTPFEPLARWRWPRIVLVRLPELVGNHSLSVRSRRACPMGEAPSHSTGRSLRRRLVVFVINLKNEHIGILAILDSKVRRLIGGDRDDLAISPEIGPYLFGMTTWAGIGTLAYPERSASRRIELHGLSGRSSIP